MLRGSAAITVRDHARADTCGSLVGRYKNLTAVMPARTPVPAGAAEPLPVLMDIASSVAPERRSEIARAGAADTARAVPADAASAGEAPAKAVAPGTAARHSAPTITRRSILLPGVH